MGEPGTWAGDKIYWPARRFRWALERNWLVSWTWRYVWDGIIRGRGGPHVKFKKKTVETIERVPPVEEPISRVAIQDRIEERRIARVDKDFATADRFRDELAAQGIVLADKPDGTTDWRRAK